MGTTSSCCPVVFVVCTESMSLCCRLSLLDSSSCSRGRFIKHSGACQVMGMTAMAVGKRMQWPASVPCMPRSRGAGQREKAVRAHCVMGVATKWSTGSALTTSLAHTHGSEETRSSIKCQDWGDLEGRGLGRAGCAGPGRKSEPSLFKGAQLNTIGYLSAFALFMYACMCVHMCGWVDAVWCVRVCFFAICESWCLVCVRQVL